MKGAPQALRHLVIALSVTLACTPAFAGRTEKAFDLVCKGKQHDRLDDLSWHDSQFLTVLHIDLTDGSFCYGSCDFVFKLTRWGVRSIRYRFDSNRQGFREHGNNPPEQAEIDNFTVSLRRMSFRRYYRYISCPECNRSETHAKKFSGKCLKAPFSGFLRRPDWN
jgi:hypothetical protein